MRRILFYVHFNKYNQLSEHVVFQLNEMKPIFEKIVLVSNSLLSQEDLARLPHDIFIQRENSGFDFAAWADGIETIGMAELAQYDSATFMNDTCFGPLYDMMPYYENYEEEAIDFWGITNHRKTKEVAEHIQSYFVVYHQKILQSKTFQSFWENVEVLDDVQEVIEYYETSLTSELIKVGYHYKTILETLDRSTSGMLHPDFSYWNPSVIVQEKVPFLKIKAVQAFKDMTPLVLNELSRQSNYPIKQIYSHMSRYVERPDEKYLLANSYLDLTEVAAQFEQPIAIHLHAFYTDLLPDFFEQFITYKFHFDLFITTDVFEKKAEIEQQLSEFKLKAQVFVTGNVGRDVLPMLKLKDKLANYEIIGHFHTKKSKEADFLVGESWRKDLIEMLVKPANQIVSQFLNQKLGLVIADIPTFFRYNEIVNAANEAKIAPHMNDLWQRMEMNKAIDFTQMATFVMSYGTFGWFRYDALHQLFDLNLTEADIPKEPLPQNSILHAIERALIYISWNNFYDFKISQNQTILTPFIDVKTMNHSQNGPINWDALGGKRALKYLIKKSLIKTRIIR
ncbi:rhamnan synthesis F family protein [Lactococcus raffinolactis]|uniref:rhamnan synthesis F family protein n=1 Tax=Pseudolactococcus raffinolactis TaxID=1366 RepID=UPI0028A120DF|nr:rhamnan synthesis F family protein [Lactococcus raffinolactis]